MNFNDKKILYVDDNKMMLSLFTKQLGRDYNITLVDTFDNAKTVIDILKQKSYDLIIADDMMPEMSGTELMKTLKSDPDFTTPIVVLTGNDQIANPREHYLNEGFDEFIAKPINSAELERVLDLFLN